MQTLAIVMGTRPEAIKLVPVYFSLSKLAGVRVLLITSGQHEVLVDQVLSFFNIVPVYDLKVMKPNQSLTEVSTRLMSQLDLLFTDINPDAVIVQGDTTTSFIAGLVTFYHRKKLIHVEAGLRTFNKKSPFPEEVNRRLTGILADIHFAPTETAKINLLAEGIDSSSVFVVGNTVIDSLFIAREIIRDNHAEYEEWINQWVNQQQRLVLVTIHRRENFGDKLKNICKAIRILASQYSNYQFLLPVHPNPNVRQTVFVELKSISQVTLIDPQPYNKMVALLDRCFIVMTDSGGIQEEAPALGKPVIILRDTTERMEGVQAGNAVLAGTEVERICEVFAAIADDSEEYKKMSRLNNPYGDGTSSDKIREILERYLKGNNG